MRYSTLHEPGVKPPANTLDAERWADLEPATKGGTRFHVLQGGETITTIHAKGHKEQVARTLARRPIKSASRCRISQYVSALRDDGALVDTEGFRPADKDRDRYGVYFLRAELVEVSA